MRKTENFLCFVFSFRLSSTSIAAKLLFQSTSKGSSNISFNKISDDFWLQNLFYFDFSWCLCFENFSELFFFLFTLADYQDEKFQQKSATASDEEEGKNCKISISNFSHLLQFSSVDNSRKIFLGLSSPHSHPQNSSSQKLIQHDTYPISTFSTGRGHKLDQSPK